MPGRRSFGESDSALSPQAARRIGSQSIRPHRAEPDPFAAASDARAEKVSRSEIRVQWLAARSEAAWARLMQAEETGEKENRVWPELPLL
jgi:hypothetical protein